MRNPQFILNLAAKLVIVFFAGAGGTCTGVEQAIERHVDYAVNHSDNALSCHAANHPQTRHLVEDVWVVNPHELTGGRPIGYIHFSPDCTHFSQAKGGQPRDRATRSLSWVVAKWGGTVAPDVITLENVEAIRRWSPLIAKRDKATTTGAQQRLVTAALAHLRTNCDARDIREPLRTVSAGGEHHALIEYHLSPDAEAGALRCAAFLMQYYSEGGQWSDLRDPLNTITTRDRLALVTVWIKGDPYVVVDICLRMLSPRELANATGFPPQYILSHGHDGRIFTKAQQVFHIGNAVPPPLQQAVTGANFSDMPAPALRRAA